MRKTKRFISIALMSLFLCVCFLFGGCSEKGEYQFEKLTYDDGETTLTLEVGEQFEGIKLKEDFFTLILRDDNVAILRMNYAEEEEGEIIDDVEVSVGTWQKGINKEIYLTFDEETAVFKKEGNRISGYFDETTITLKK